jgi:hypothetical protein
MKPILRTSVALALASVLAASAASPTFARDWRPWAAAGAGFAAGAVVGSAVANSYYGPRYYGSGYAYEPGYAYDSYAYEPGYVVETEPTYVVETEPTYVAPAPQIVYEPRRCWVQTDKDRGFGYWGSCGSSGAALVR